MSQEKKEDIPKQDTPKDAAAPSEKSNLPSTPQIKEASKEIIKVQEPEPEWSTFQLTDSSGFVKIKNEVLENIKKDLKGFYPRISEMLGKILDICLDDFNFVNVKPSYEEYMEFFQELNQIIPCLKTKIMRDNCNSTVFYIGDSHGSIEDSFLLIDFFSKIIKKDSKAKFVFVGDYVDRNPWDLENLVLVTAFSLLFPNNVVLLRGNHEDRTINSHYGFFDNLLRYYHENGEKLYDEIIKFFMHLPIAHIAQMFTTSGDLGARVLALHGGIPVDWQNFLEPIILDKIEPQLQCEFERSEQMDPYTNSMLWSDPDELIQNIVTDGDSGRLKFGLGVFTNFMNANNFHLLVRGHQKWNEGYKKFFGDQLYSLFSTSKYDDKKKFEPKILMLELGKAPKIIDIKQEVLEKELKEYKV